MKLKAFAGILLLVLMTLTFVSCDGYTFTIKNNTGVDIYFMYIMHSDENGDITDTEDVLGTIGILEAGDSYTLTNTFFEKEGTYNIRLEDENDGIYTFTNVDVATMGTLKVTADHMTE